MGDTEAAPPRTSDHTISTEEQHAAEVAAILVALTERAALRTPDMPRLTALALNAVEERDRPSLGELARALRITPATASRLCGRLEATGLLTKQTDSRDHRRLVLALTPQGRERLHTHRTQSLHAVATALRLPAGRHAPLLRALAILREELLHHLGTGEP